MLPVSVKRTSRLVLRISSIQGLGATVPLCSTATAAEARDGGGDKGAGSSPGRDFGLFLKAVGGIAACGSGLGLWYASSNSSTFSSSVPSQPETLGVEVAFGRDSRADLEEGAPRKAEAGRGKKIRYLFGDAYRRRVFFNYEKRIRMLSPPEKVFEYFATFCTPEGDVLMTPGDLMRQLSLEGYLRGEPQPGELHCAPSEFFMLFDTNSDGLISFPEYIFFVTLLSIPESSFSVAFKMFDVDNNGEIDKEEFKKVMTLMRSGRPVEDGGLVEYFFGKDGSRHLKHDKFVQFLRDLHEEIIRLEFAHYDCKSKGTISAKDFAFSMVAAAEIGHMNRFLDRVEQLDDCSHLRDVRITFEEFKAFADLRERLQKLELALFGYGKVNGLLTKGTSREPPPTYVCGVFLTDNVVDIIFHVFDVNRDKNLSSEEFLRALRRREMEVRQPTSASRWVNGAARTSSLAHMFL
ncbi:unnamed protein product [Spirodela intermedia]|uniref:EF-hand domain-containing protein n=1 Tax=Spirodela intermedia TaxID=51605 RepID=A0A7I8JR45_SPIIN|nr:unnamed protein product [Spirodela intermedia]CAA6672626.1 unnamed protein product [Spirodela intermedia]